MYKFDYDIAKAISVHSFGRYQMSVIIAVDKKGNTSKGIAIFPLPSSTKFFERSMFIEANGLLGMAMVISSSEAKRICDFIYRVSTGSLPQEILIRSSGPDIKIKLKKYTANWHGGGAYKGVMGYSEYSFLGFLPGVKISKKSLAGFRASLNTLYEQKEQTT
jgi:hypothetical protein